MYMTLSKPMNSGPNVVSRDLPRKGGKVAISDHIAMQVTLHPRLAKA